MQSILEELYHGNIGFDSRGFLQIGGMPRKWLVFCSARHISAGMLTHFKEM